MKTTKVMKGFVLALAAVVLAGTGAVAGELAMWGSTTCQKRFLEPGAEALEKATGVKIKVFGVGTGKGVLALLDGKTSVALTSSTLEDSLASAKKAAKEQGQADIKVPGNIKFHPITEDVIVPIVHKDNPVAELTYEQLTDLNTGKVKNWKEIGGPDVAVQVVTSHEGSSTREVFQKQVMKKAPYAAGALQVTSTRLELNEVSKNKGGIGAVSEGFYNQNPGNCKIVKTAPISRPLAFITLGEPTPEVQKVIDFFLSAEGKKFIVD